MLRPNSEGYPFGPFYLSFHDHLLLRGGKELDLRPQSVELLRVLVEHADEILTYDELREKAWEKDTHVTRHTVIETMREIRKALGEYKGCIENKPKRGYRFSTSNLLRLEKAVRPEAQPFAQGLSGTGQATGVQVYVWWPVPDGAAVAGMQPFQARLPNLPLSAYRVYWQVDGSVLTEMPDCTVPNDPTKDHKEAAVDVSKFGIGPHTVTFVAKNMSGKFLGKWSVSIRVIG